MPAWEWEAAVLVRVIDGDSVIARLTRDIGFHGTTTFEQRLRLNRINAPEGTDTPAAKWLRENFAVPDVETPVHITTLKPYAYGDVWMAEITFESGAGPRNVSDVLVELGHAVHWDGRGARPNDKVS